jgi:hypothetical protein
MKFITVFIFIYSHPKNNLLNILYSAQSLMPIYLIIWLLHTNNVQYAHFYRFFGPALVGGTSVHFTYDSDSTVRALEEYVSDFDSLFVTYVLML